MVLARVSVHEDPLRPEPDIRSYKREGVASAEALKSGLGWMGVQSTKELEEGGQRHGFERISGLQAHNLASGRQKTLH